MEFWNHKINVSKEAATRQVEIINKLPSKKRMKIAMDFANMGVNRTRDWIKEINPNLSGLELNLAFVKIMYYENGTMTEDTWNFYKSKMEKKIKKDWVSRFRNMMQEKKWTYEDIAKMGNFKSGKVIEATISRGLPAFAKLSVRIHELSKEKTIHDTKN